MNWFRKYPLRISRATRHKTTRLGKDILLTIYKLLKGEQFQIYQHYSKEYKVMKMESYLFFVGMDKSNVYGFGNRLCMTDYVRRNLKPIKLKGD